MGLGSAAELPQTRMVGGPVGSLCMVSLAVGGETLHHTNRVRAQKKRNENLHPHRVHVLELKSQTTALLDRNTPGCQLLIETLSLSVQASSQTALIPVSHL